MKKNLSLIINDTFYSNLNKHIEMNLRLRSLKYFSKKKKAIEEEIVPNNNIRKKNIKRKGLYTGGYIRTSPYGEKKENLFESSIFDKNYIPIESKENIDTNINNKEKNQITIKKSRSSKPLKTLIDHAIDSPFKYNPNYKSIYKNIRTIKINPKQYSIEIKNKINSNMKRRKKKIDLVKKEKNLIKMKKCEAFAKTKKKEFFKNNKNYKIINRDNHALSFDKMVSRNQTEKIKNKSNNKILTYIRHFNFIANNKHKIVNFKKMKPHNDIITNQLNEIFMHSYTPKYNVIDKNISSVIFEPKEKIKNFQKKIKLRKVLSSYKVFRHYETIDETKLESNKIKNIKKT